MDGELIQTVMKSCRVDGSEHSIKAKRTEARRTYFNKKQATDTIWPEKNDVLNLRSKFPDFYPRQ